MFKMRCLQVQGNVEFSEHPGSFLEVSEECLVSLADPRSSCTQCLTPINASDTPLGTL